MNEAIKLINKFGKFPIEGFFSCHVTLEFKSKQYLESTEAKIAIDEFNTKLEVLGYDFAKMLEQVCQEKFL